MKKRIKVISLVMAAVCVLSCISVYAYDKYVATADFKIKLNNRDIHISKEIVTIDGSTYLPLRALCEEMLGMEVIWHDDTRMIELWNITKPSDRGSHESPISMGVAVSGEFKAKDKTFVNYDFAIEDVERGYSVETQVEQWYRAANPLEVSTYDGEPNDKDAYKNYQEKIAKQRAKYEEQVDEYMTKVLGDSSKYELLKAKVHIDIKPSASTFELSTKDNDTTPYCGYVEVDGMQRQYVEYDMPKVIMPSEFAYSDRTILTNGVQEGYIIYRVYKNDAYPRIMYKDGQYLALYK